MRIVRHRYIERIDPNRGKNEWYLAIEVDERPEADAFSFRGRYGSRVRTGAGRYEPASGRGSQATASSAFDAKVGDKLSGGYVTAPMPGRIAGLLREIDPGYDPIRGASSTLAPVAVTGEDEGRRAGFTMPATVALDAFLAAASDGRYAACGRVAGLRARCAFDAGGRASLSVAGRPLDGADRLLHAIDRGTPALTDTVLDGFIVAAGADRRLVLTDVLRYRDEDVRDLPLWERHALLVQAIGELDAAGQLSASWLTDVLRAGPDKAAGGPGGIWLRDLGAAYDPASADAWLVAP